MLSPVTKKVRRKPGQFVEIDLGDGSAAVGRVLAEPVMAFYGRRFRRGQNWDLEEIAREAIAFRIPVMNHAVTSGQWRVIGAAPLSEELKEIPEFFRQDAVTGDLFIYQEIPELAPTYERPADLSECLHLERAAVWEPSHVEDRLRDLFADKPNRWREDLRPKSR